MLIILINKTAALLTFVTYSFTQHPEILSELRSEILERCPGETIPTYDDLREMKYCKYCSSQGLDIPDPYKQQYVLCSTKLSVFGLPSQVTVGRHAQRLALSLRPHSRISEILHPISRCTFRRTKISPTVHSSSNGEKTSGVMTSRYLIP